MKQRTDDDPIVCGEDAAITAEKMKMEAEEKADSEVENEKAENAIRELSWPVKIP